MYSPRAYTIEDVPPEPVVESGLTDWVPAVYGMSSTGGEYHLMKDPFATVLLLQMMLTSFFLVPSYIVPVLVQSAMMVKRDIKQVKGLQVSWKRLTP